MPSVLELDQPKVKELERPPALPPKAPSSAPALQVVSGRTYQRVLFSDSLLESDSPERRRRSLATTFSFAFECVLVGILLIVPLMFTEALPSQQLLMFLVAPPPPPPPPPPAAPIVKVVQTDVLNNGRLRTPTRIPQKVEMIREEEAPPPAMAGGVVGGVPGGIPGGQLGGVIGGIISSSSNLTSIVPKLQPVKRIRVSQGITQGMLINKIQPTYPRLASLAHVAGAVLLHAIISKEGEITELQAISGHPLLVPAAMEAVRQWRYRPYLLSGVPVEVETNITVTFQISN